VTFVNLTLVDNVPRTRENFHATVFLATLLTLVTRASRGPWRRGCCKEVSTAEFSCAVVSWFLDRQLFWPSCSRECCWLPLSPNGRRMKVWDATVRSKSCGRTRNEQTTNVAGARCFSVGDSTGVENVGAVARSCLRHSARISIRRDRTRMR